jgi:hypothetical protein
MTNRLRVAVACTAIALVAAATAHAQSDFVINPQIGMTLSRLSTDPGDFHRSSRVGYQFGGFLRLGERTYLQPGVFWIRSGTKLEGRDAVTTELVKSSTDVQGFYIPVALGADIAGGEALKLRANLGGSATIVTTVNSNDFGLTKDDFKSVIWSARVGVGVDVTNLTFDAAYDLGLSNVFKSQPDFSSDAKNNIFTLTAGLKFF